jgi:acetyl esterase
MFEAPKEKNYTREELIKKADILQDLSKKMSQLKRQKTKTNGDELFLCTSEGRIRVLAYNLENPQKLPLFVNIHGGAFILGDPELDDPYMINIALGANVKILNIDYSLSPRAVFPQALNECYSVVKYAQDHPDEFGIDPQNISVCGHSAGGNLSAAVCLKNSQTKELNIKSLILVYPVTDGYTDPYLKPKGNGVAARIYLSPKMLRFFNVCYCHNKEERKNPLISPVYAGKEQLKTFPPALIITAGKDSLCAEAELFRDMLIKAGVETAHKRFESAPHGFTHDNNNPDARECWQMIIDFLKRKTN